jgi:hypothetical protein
MIEKALSVKILKDLVTAVILTLLAVLLGLAVMAQVGSSLKTAVVREADDMQEVSYHFDGDYVTLEMPNDEEALIEGEEICASPSPSASPSTSSSPSQSPSNIPQSTDIVAIEGLSKREQVLGDKIAIIEQPGYEAQCVTNFKGPVPNNYEIGEKTERQSRVPIRATDAIGIIATLCMGIGQEIPDCHNPRAIGCTNVDFVNPNPFKYKMVGLIEIKNEIVKFVSGTVISGSLSSENSKAVYPAAPMGNEEVDVKFNLYQYTFYPSQERTLASVHPKLLEIAKNMRELVREHEKVHWGIFDTYLNKYFGLMNNPKVPDDQNSIEEAIAEMKRLFREAWEEIQRLENNEHKKFHDEEERPEYGIIPLDGWYVEGYNVVCSGVEAMSVEVNTYVLGEGKGSVTAKMIGAGSGTREIEIDDESILSEGYQFFKGSDILLTAEPDEGYVFESWEDAYNHKCPLQGPDRYKEEVIVKADEDVGCVAVFVEEVE